MSYFNRQHGFTDSFLDDSEELVNLVTKEFGLEDMTSAVLGEFGEKMIDYKIDRNA